MDYRIVSGQPTFPMLRPHSLLPRCQFSVSHDTPHPVRCHSTPRGTVRVTLKSQTAGQLDRQTGGLESPIVWRRATEDFMCLWQPWVTVGFTSRTTDD